MPLLSLVTFNFIVFWGFIFLYKYRRNACWVEDGLIQQRWLSVFRKKINCLSTFFETNSLFLFLVAGHMLVNDYNSPFGVMSHVNLEISFKLLVTDNCRSWFRVCLELFFSLFLHPYLYDILRKKCSSKLVIHISVTALKG